MMGERGIEVLEREPDPDEREIVHAAQTPSATRKRETML
jgi:hypothetical protein